MESEGTVNALALAPVLAALAVVVVQCLRSHRRGPEYICSIVGCADGMWRWEGLGTGKRSEIVYGEPDGYGSARLAEIAASGYFRRSRVEWRYYVVEEGELMVVTELRAAERRRDSRVGQDDA